MTRDKEKILLVEDDDALRNMLEEELKDAGLQVRSCSDALNARHHVATWHPDLVISDLRLPKADGLWLLHQTRDTAIPPGFIIMTAFGTVSQAVEALKQGADDFITKPLDLDHFNLCIKRSLETRRLRQDVQRYRNLLNLDDFHGMIGRSALMNTLFAAIRQISQAQGPVLITGESGTGKDLAARAIHRESHRKDSAFVAVNCAAIPAELQESEFFGHAAGSFTGAGRYRKGLFAEAEGGTLFLDEIGNMPLDLQAKLLRILQDGKVRAVGTNHEEEVDVRIVAATNSDLEQAVRLGAFREDLYYRLETFQLEVPPLRHRGDDLDLLVARFIDLFNVRLGRHVSGISAAALELLRAYPFPGNVRELRNAIERAFAFCTEGEISSRSLPQRIRNASRKASQVASGFFSEGTGPGRFPSLEEMTNQYVAYVLEQLNGNKRQAAQVLAISRATLYRRLGEGQEE
ncbi:MAG: sigma-54 dependent transcriptional regulator [Pelovirga sp.]